MKNKMFDKILSFFRKPTTYQQSKKEIDSVDKTPVTEEFEHCVICGRLTCVPISMPIDRRENYEVGMGQICSECAKKTQEEADWVKTLSDEQILIAVEQCRKENNG